MRHFIFSLLRRFTLLLLGCYLIGCVNIPLFANAYAQDTSSAQIRYAALLPSDEQYTLNADINLRLSNQMEQLLTHGIPLFFVAELNIQRPRWYWFDETIVERRLNLRLSYHSLTRSYRLSLDNLHQNFSTLADAVYALSHIRNWSIIERSGLRAGQSYEAALRFHFDLAQMAKPFQAAALGSHELNLTTEWQRWVFLASPLEPK